MGAAACELLIANRTGAFSSDAGSRLAISILRALIPIIFGLQIGMSSAVRPAMSAPLLLPQLGLAARSQASSLRWSRQGFRTFAAAAAPATAAKRDIVKEAHGFELVESQFVKEYDSMVARYRHKKTGKAARFSAARRLFQGFMVLAVVAVPTSPMPLVHSRAKRQKFGLRCDTCGTICARASYTTVALQKVSYEAWASSSSTHCLLLESLGPSEV